MMNRYPITPRQVALLTSAKRDLENAQTVLNALAAMALAGAGIETGNLADVKNGAMIVQTPDEDAPDTIAQKRADEAHTPTTENESMTVTATPAPSRRIE